MKEIIMLKTREEVIEYARQIYITTGLPPRRDQIVKAGVMHYRDFKQYFRSIDEVLLILGIESYAVTIREQKVVHKECAVCNKKFKTKFHNRVTCSQQCENIHTGNTDLNTSLIKKFNYLYKITNNINGKIYIGIHSTDNLDDGYMGSGVALGRAYTKYGAHNFTKEILENFTDPKDMYLREEEMVNEEFIARSDVYNMKIGGVSGKVSTEVGSKIKLKFKEIKHQAGETNSQYGTVWITHYQLEKSHKISLDLLPFYIDQGWVLGPGMDYHGYFLTKESRVYYRLMQYLNSECVNLEEYASINNVDIRKIKFEWKYHLPEYKLILHRLGK